MTHDLLLPAAHPPEPGCVSLVQLGPGPLGHGLVDRIAEEGVLEPESIVTRGAGIGKDELAVDQPHQSRPQRAADAFRQQLKQRSAPKCLANDGGSFEDGALVAFQPIDTSCQ
jgi:hypothetical protein